MAPRLTSSLRSGDIRRIRTSGNKIIHEDRTSFNSRDFRTGLKESDADEGIQERDSFDYIWEQSLEKSQTSAR